MKLRRACSIFRKPFYGSFGFKSVIIRPIMIKGRKNIFIGKNVTFRNGARIECVKSWREQKFNPRIEIGNNVSFEQGAHIVSASNLKIGDNCVFSIRAMIITTAHSHEQVDRSVLENELITKDVVIGKNCFFGADVKIFPGVTIGDNVIVGANSLVRSDLPSYTICVGNPAKPVKKYDFDSKTWVKL